MKKLIGVMLAAGVLVFAGSNAWAVDGQLNANDAHAELPVGTQGVCAKCHVPHGGQGDKIWASNPAIRTDFDGVQQLCNTCHYSGSTVGAAFYTVFIPVGGVGNRMNHVMQDWADTAGSVISPAYSATNFPLGSITTGNVGMPWSAADPDGVVGDDGFYCGSCHNPHKQPFSAAGVTAPVGAGDYLRASGLASVSDNMANFGAANARNGACRQCHNAVFVVAGAATGHQGNCSICHDPHEAVNLPAGNAQLAEKILITNAAGSPFVAQPNVPGFTASSYEGLIAGICFGCHSTATGASGSLPAGSQKVISNTLEHHPMGLAAPSALGAAEPFDHAPAWTAQSISGDLTCTSCHNMHDNTYDYYLKAFGTAQWNAQDDPDWCQGCHSQNTTANLGTAGQDHRQTSAFDDATGAGQRGNCMFCHYIHDGTANAGASVANGAGIDPSEDALMRQNATALRWADVAADTDALDYEDMCAGCHMNTTITGVAGSGSFFDSTAGVMDWFSHRTNTAPMAGAGNTLALATAAGLPMYASAASAPAPETLSHAYDGSAGGSNGAGQMFCGTCHNVHVQPAAAVDADGNYFRITNNVGVADGTRSALCTACHGASPMAGAAGRGTGSSTTHPVGAARTALPKPPFTSTPVVAAYGNGGDGYQGGRTTGGTPGGAGNATGNMQCETCHNFHVAVTNHVGGAADHTTAGTAGKLMIIDNSTSTLCDTCHSNY